MLRFICGLKNEVDKTKPPISPPLNSQTNTLRERYAKLKLLISQKNDEICSLCEEKANLKYAIIAQDIQEMPRDYKENLARKLQHLKEFVDNPSIYDARYVVILSNKSPESCDTIEWRIVEYTIEINTYVEIVITVLQACVRTFVREWLNKNCVKLQHTKYIYPTIM